MIVNSDGSIYPRHPEQRPGEVHCFNGETHQSSWDTVRSSSTPHADGRFAFFVQKAEMEAFGWKCLDVGGGLTVWYTHVEVELTQLGSRGVNLLSFEFPMNLFSPNAAQPASDDLMKRVLPILQAA